MSQDGPTQHELLAKIANLKTRLEDAEELLRAIRAGEVDALVVESPVGPQIFTLQGLDAEAARFRADMLAQVSEAVFAIDKDRRITYLNAAAERHYSVLAADALGCLLGEIFQERWLNPNDEASAAASIEMSGYWRGENLHAKRNGTTVHVETSMSRLALDGGCSSGMLVVIRDITERKKLDEVLRNNEALFSTIIEQAPGGVVVIDDQFRILKVNALARPTFAAAEPLIGREFGDVMRILWGPSVGAELAAIFRQTLETGQRHLSPRFVERRDDLGTEKSYNWETQRITLPSGRNGVVSYFTDTTEQHEYEKALREAKDAAEAANASKDRFLAVLSHELRTPLTPVLMIVGALEHDPELSHEVREDLVMIKRNIELETKLIDDLLDLSRVTSGKVELKTESVDLNEAVSYVCGICRPQFAEKNVRLETELGPGVGTITSDPARLQQIMWNVIKNAAKFTPKHGLVRVSTARLDDDLCEVRVIDNGIGIPADVLPKIFNAFEQGDADVTRQFGGLGLGLAISRALVELLGGAIRAESEGPTKGAMFIIQLPGRQPAPLAATPAEAEVGANTTPIRVLLVEDHVDTARAVGRLLRKAGFSVVPAASVSSAVALAESEPFDILVSDLGLPDGNGYEVMRAIRARRVVPGIAMSGYGMDEDIRRSAEAGFVEHMVKPVKLPELIAAIRRVTETRA